MNTTETQSAGSLHPLVRRGWRHFHCSECEHRWKWPSRDALSPSGDNCPRCDEWCHPYNGEIDATIPCDDMGNLTVPWNWTGEALNAGTQRPGSPDGSLATETRKPGSLK